MSSPFSHRSPASSTTSTSSAATKGCNALPSRCPFCLGPVCPVKEHQKLHVPSCQTDEEGEVLEVCGECGCVHPDEVLNEVDYDARAWEGEGLSKRNTP